MLYQTYKKILILFLAISIVLFSGCTGEEEDKKKDTPTQNEDSSNFSDSDNGDEEDESSDNSSNSNSDSSDYEDTSDNYNDDSGENDNNSNSNNEDSQDNSSDDTTFGDRTEYHEVYAERRLTIEIDVSATIKNVKYSHGEDHYIDDEKKKLYYIPKNRYIGKDEIKIEFYDTDEVIIYKVNIKKPPLEENRDFVISYGCERGSKYLDNSVKSFDISILDDELILLEKVYDDKKYSLSSPRIPKVSKNYLEYHSYYSDDYSDYYTESIRHHNIFKNHIDDNIMITCNYPNGYFSLVYPINREEWYATKPYNDNLRFSRNDLYFYVSSLSHLHSKIYLKEYQSGTTSDNSYIKANQFMDKVFPNSHYTAELAHNYDAENNKWIEPYQPEYYSFFDKFNSENELYYDKITFLADEVSDGDIPLLLQKIANNYESYYLSGNNQCLDSTICGTLFPEYTKSVTSNPKFESGLNSWNKREEFASPATGKIEFFPTKNEVNIEYIANRPNSSENPISSLDLYQTELLNGNNIDDYFLRFDLSELYGGSDGGHPTIAGASSSGFAGVYACYKDNNNEDIGCMAWSDHTNKFDIAWGVGQHRIESSETFNNYRVNNVFRRLRPNAEQFVFTIHLGEYMKTYLPEIYKRKYEIKSIEYGLFATEFRNKANGCYFCEANEINLLKVK